MVQFCVYIIWRLSSFVPQRERGDCFLSFTACCMRHGRSLVMRGRSSGCLKMWLPWESAINEISPAF